jgi:hypothetical protein
MWVSLWGNGISELKKFSFISKFRVSIKTQLMKTSKAHSHSKHYCPTIISETWYADILTRNRGWKERVPLILRGLIIASKNLSAFQQLQANIQLEWLKEGVVGQIELALYTGELLFCHTDRHSTPMWLLGGVPGLPNPTISGKSYLSIFAFGQHLFSRGSVVSVAKDFLNASDWTPACQHINSTSVLDTPVIDPNYFDYTFGPFLSTWKIIEGWMYIRRSQGSLSWTWSWWSHCLRRPAQRPDRQRRQPSEHHFWIWLG